MKIGIIGTGNIAAYVLEQVNEKHAVPGQVTAIFGRNQETGPMLSERFNVDFYDDMEAFLESPLDIVVEASAVEAAKLYCKKVVSCQKDLVVSSIGVFQNLELLEDIQTLAQSKGVTVYLPSGAIGGLDLVQSANAVHGLERVQITTRKSPGSLGLKETHGEAVLFEGSARKAIGKFPKNVNVALVLSLAGLGIDETTVRVIVDPKIERNTHTIEAEGTFGNMHLQVENNPMPANPKTSLLAALSIVAVLKNKDQALKIGN